jgi:uncharacterized DUF497 family protein
VLPVTFDPAKNAANRAKHGMDLADASDFDFNTAIIEEDRDVRHEWRLQATGWCGGRLRFLVFVPHDEGDGIHAISLRPLTRKEARRYAERIGSDARRA